MSRRGVALLAVLVLALGGCDDDGRPSGAGGDTRTATLVDRDGDGTLERGPGEALRARGGSARPIATLATWAQLTDPHVRDEESPARVPFLDRLGAPLSSTFRPQEALAAHVLDAAATAVAAQRPDAVVVTGDIADNAQENELGAALAVLRGGRVDPDSGARGPSGPQLRTNPDPFLYRPDVDAPRHPGLLERAQRPFRAAGLGVPWVPLLGNHDLLVQGELAPDARARAYATGGRAVVELGPEVLEELPRPQPDRDGEGGVGTVSRAAVERVLAAGRSVAVRPDPARRLLTAERAEALMRAASGTADLTAFPLGPRVRGLALDLVRRRGGSDGEVTPATLAALRRGLAAAGDRPVVVFTHHPLDRAAGGEAVLDVLERDPRVVAAIAGHTHRHEVRRRGRLWLVTTASLADFPQQARMFRLARTAGGGLALETWLVDHGPGPGGLAGTARELAFLDAQGGRPAGAAGGRDDRNVRLRIR